jgi:uncharacterized membrane protein YedE/YeeE
MTMLKGASFFCGLVFGTGLLISGMTDTQKVLGFLDVLGKWDPTLAFVMVGALAVSGAGYALIRPGTPIMAGRHLWPEKRKVDQPLIVGAVLFGIGWGLVGLCPGPAIENLASLSPKVIVFVLAMIVGIVVHDRWLMRVPEQPYHARDAALVTGNTDG